MASAEALRAHRQALLDLSTLTEAELRKVWAAVQSNNADAVVAALIEVLPLIGEKYGDMAAAVGADFYEQVREEAAARGRFVAEPAPLPGSARYEALARWGVDPLYAATPDAAAALSRLSGGLQRVVSNQSRDTITLNAVRDPAAAGWARSTRPGSCRFCTMLAGRGSVYTEATVRFAAHDHCHCIAAPAFKGGEPVSVLQYAASKRHQSEADRARVREFMASIDT